MHQHRALLRAEQSVHVTFEVTKMKGRNGIRQRHAHRRKYHAG